MISKFGQYQGYTQKVYDGYKRSSDYMSLANETRLAYDLFLPTKKGIIAQQPLPVLFLYTPYLRVFTVFDKSGKSTLIDLEAMAWYESDFLRLRSWLSPNGNLIDAIFRRKWLKRMLDSGYAVFVAERPGTGASFGKVDLSNAAMAKESDEILNWMAGQPWCDGNIGMFGDSIQAQVQFAAASTGNPHLKAIMPASTWFDNYSATMYPGGIYDKAFGSFFVWSQKLLDSPLITPVDTDPHGVLLAEALSERRSATTADVAHNIFPKVPFRDSRTPGGLNLWDQSFLLPHLDRINRSGVPVYLFNGWFDLLARDNFLIYANLGVPKRLTVRPTDHSNIDRTAADLDFGTESQRWFDYWLKGIDNGIMEEPPIHYYLLNGNKQTAWQTSNEWPLKDQQSQRYYLAARGRMGQASGRTSGSLRLELPEAQTNSDSYTVDYTTSSGLKTRWVAVEQAHQYTDMRGNDAKSMTYTTAPLEKSIKVIGHPIVEIWLCSQAADLDAFVYLEEVDQAGNSTYVTEGNLRASHRALAQPSFDNLGLPYHTHFLNDQKSIPADEPVELVFDLLPTAYQFSKGKSIRLTLAFADADNFDTPVLEPVPILQLLRDAGHLSYVEIPA
jgi:uncharacterized protein